MGADLASIPFACAPYQSIKVLNMVKLYGKPIRVNKAATDKNANDVGANLFIGNLDPDVDEKLLYDTFSAFGVIINTPKVCACAWVGNGEMFERIESLSGLAADACIQGLPAWLVGLARSSPRDSLAPLPIHARLLTHA